MRIRLASAGTGKTTALVLEVLHALETLPAQRIAAVTFTRVGASDLDQKIHSALAALEGGPYLDYQPPDPEAHHQNRSSGTVFATTLHGFTAAVLRVVAPEIGLDPDFTILDDVQAQAIFNEEMESDRLLNGWPGEWQEILAGAFSKRSLAPRLQATGAVSQDLLRVFNRIQKRYQDRLAAKRLSPNDLELKAWDWIKNGAPGAARVRQRWHLALIDEYQDTSPLQGQLFTDLEKLGLTLVAAGDPKQSIYAFRNAEVEVFRRALQHSQVDPPLTTSYRHPERLAKFLNRLTTTLAQGQMGFFPPEAPPVISGRGGAATVELIWNTGEASLPENREREASILATRLAKLNQEGRPWAEMAVLIRAHSSRFSLIPAFEAAGIPWVAVSGRGFGQLAEVRDLYWALRLGLDPANRQALACFLRGPLVSERPEVIADILNAADPLKQLGPLQEPLNQLADLVQSAPAWQSAHQIVHRGIAGLPSLVSRVGPAAQVNLEALVAELHQYGPMGGWEAVRLIENLKLDDHLGEVPQSGQSAVLILTIHQAKGLEWPVVAVFDLSRTRPSVKEPFYIEPGSGRLALAGEAQYSELAQEWQERLEQEEFRLFYVAASRASQHLILSASQGKRGFAGIAQHLQEFDLPAWSEVTQVGAAQLAQRPAEAPGPAAEPVSAPPVPPGRWPLVVSASYLRSQLETEPATAPSVYAPSARAIGLLTHYAIANDLEAHASATRAQLAQQAILHQFDDPERQIILDRVNDLIANYVDLSTHPKSSRAEDYAEMPFVFAWQDTVVEGVIDRIYRVGNRWYLEDYKTDANLDYQKYLGQMAIYQHAALQLFGEPQARLVFLAVKKSVVLSSQELASAFPELGGTEPYL